MKPYLSCEGFEIYHGDALEVLPTLERKFDVIATDPPYSSGGAFRGDRAASTVTKYVNGDTATYRPEFGGDTRDQRGFFAWSTLWLLACRQVTNAGGPLVMFSDWRQLPIATDSVQAAGWLWRNLATWWKPACRMQKGRFSSSAEYVVYGTNGPTAGGMASPQNVFQYAVEREKLHIAQKPLAVMRWVLGVAPENGVVLDPFMGSGSTLIAARSLGMRAVGIDADERYCAMAAERLRQEFLF